MHDTHPSDKMIATRIVQLSPELLRRYGMATGCNRAQFDRTVSDMKIEAAVVAYLSAVFLTDADFQVYRAEIAAANWEEVENRAERIYQELQHTSRSNDDFRESWIGANGIGA